MWMYCISESNKTFKFFPFMISFYVIQTEKRKKTCNKNEKYN